MKKILLLCIILTCSLRAADSLQVYFAHFQVFSDKLSISAVKNDSPAVIDEYINILQTTLSHQQNLLNLIKNFDAMNVVDDIDELGLLKRIIDFQINKIVKNINFESSTLQTKSAYLKDPALNHYSIHLKNYKLYLVRLKLENDF